MRYIVTLLKKLCLKNLCEIAALPRSIDIFSSHVTVSCKLRVDGTAESEALDDSSGTEIEMTVQRICDLLFSYLCGSKGINKNRYGASYADRVSNLDLATLCKTCGNNVLCKITCCIASGTVNINS